jgi:hypothetical protein
MASEYSELYNNDIDKLRDGLDILDRVVDSIDGLDIWLYGIVTNPNVLEVARGAIIKYDEPSMDDHGNSTLEDGDVQVTEIGVYLLVSPDVIDMLNGSGYPLRDLRFVYQEGDGEGTRNSLFSDSDSLSNDDTIRTSDMGEIAVAQSESYIDKYFTDKSNKLKVGINRKVRRNEEATEHPHPVGAQPEPTAPAPAQPAANAAPVTPGAPVPKQTSLKLSKIVEEFLGL